MKLDSFNSWVLSKLSGNEKENHNKDPKRPPKVMQLNFPKLQDVISEFRDLVDWFKSMVGAE